jgi:hypothetical protein
VLEDSARHLNRVFRPGDDDRAPAWDLGNIGVADGDAREQLVVAFGDERTGPVEGPHADSVGAAAYDLNANLYRIVDGICFDHCLDLPDIRIIERRVLRASIRGISGERSEGRCTKGYAAALAYRGLGRETPSEKERGISGSAVFS